MSKIQKIIEKVLLTWYFMVVLAAVVNLIIAMYSSIGNKNCQLNDFKLPGKVILEHNGEYFQVPIDQVVEARTHGGRTASAKEICEDKIGRPDYLPFLFLVGVFVSTIILAKWLRWLLSDYIK